MGLRLYSAQLGLGLGLGLSLAILLVLLLVSSKSDFLKRSSSFLLRSSSDHGHALSKVVFNLLLVKEL